MLAYLLAALVVVIAAAIAFGIAALLHMQGLTYLLFVALILLFGISAAIVIIVMHLRAKKESGSERDGVPSEAKAELDLLVNDANRKLRESQQGAKTLEYLPLIYILGDENTAKTTIVLQSGLEPELLAGSISKDSAQIPTPILNIWYTRHVALVEIGHSVRQSNPLLAGLVHRTRATAYRSAFGSGAAPRAVIVCLSAEQLTGSNDILLASAKAHGAQLREISRNLGTPVAVYVIITKLDRVPHFEEYVRNLSDDEVRQTLGATLDRIEISAGTYADQASRTIAASMGALVFKLGGFRMEALDRENDPASTSGVYEFPREFGKLRKNLNQYLVELCKPSQLSASPYLRGYYFTGVRARIVERSVAAPAVAEVTVPNDAGATQFLNLAALRAKAANQSSAPVITSSRVPQWTFLPRLLPEVILGDKSALAPTRQSTPARIFRRVLFGTLTSLFAVATCLVLVSYSKNAALEDRIRGDAEALRMPASVANVPPTLTQLQKLDDLREVIVQLDDEQKNGKPLSYRFGLYQGDRLRDSARRIYFDRFRPMLLEPAQSGFVQTLKSLPDVPDANSRNDRGAYDAAYDPLKAYFITTDPNFNTPHRLEKRDIAALVPVFLRYWKSTRQDSNDSAPLGQKQIEFYGNELLLSPPYRLEPDGVAVKRAQDFLSTFGDKNRVYENMLADADNKNQTIDFNKQFPNPYVKDGLQIRGAFTRDGFGFMQDALQHPDRYTHGEIWVLGDHTSATLDLSRLSTDLSVQYASDYQNRWHQFLVNAHIEPCGGLNGAVKELQALAEPTSPILELLYVISHNTAIANQQIKDVFQPAQVVVDPNSPDRFIGAGNKVYTDSLFAMGAAIEGALAQNPNVGSDAMAFGQQISPSVQEAQKAVQQLSSSFNIDKENQTQALVIGLLNQPIGCVDRLKPSPGAAAGGAGDKICQAINPLRAKFPFLYSGQVPASLSEVDSVFTPDTGLLWINYNGVLRQYLVPSGGQANASYVPVPNAPASLDPRFISYFNRAAHISNTLYPPGQKSPSFSFSLRFLPGNGVKNATLVVDGQRIQAGASPQPFTWTGKASSTAFLSYDDGEALNKTGPWALFELIRRAKIIRSGSGYHLEYVITDTPTVAGEAQKRGSEKSANFELYGPGADLLAGDGLALPACVKAVRK